MTSRTENQRIYSELEAAAKLGIELDELRWLVRRHFPDVQLENTAPHFFRRADLILLAHLRTTVLPLASSTLS